MLMETLKQLSFPRLCLNASCDTERDQVCSRALASSMVINSLLFLFKNQQFNFDRNLSFIFNLSEEIGHIVYAFNSAARVFGLVISKIPHQRFPRISFRFIYLNIINIIIILAVFTYFDASSFTTCPLSSLFSSTARGSFEK